MLHLCTLCCRNWPHNMLCRESQLLSVPGTPDSESHTWTRLGCQEDRSQDSYLSGWIAQVIGFSTTIVVPTGMSCEATTYLPLPFWYFTLTTELAASNFVFLFSILRIVSFCFSAVDFVTCTGPSDMCFSSDDIFAKLSLVSFKNLSFFFLSSLENFRELIASSKAYRASLYLWIYYCKLHIY